MCQKRRVPLEVQGEAEEDLGHGLAEEQAAEPAPAPRGGGGRGGGRGRGGAGRRGAAAPHSHDHERYPWPLRGGRWAGGRQRLQSLAHLPGQAVVGPCTADALLRGSAAGRQIAQYDDLEGPRVGAQPSAAAAAGAAASTAGAAAGATAAGGGGRTVTETRSPCCDSCFARHLAPARPLEDLHVLPMQPQPLTPLATGDVGGGPGRK
mmetsp:Transcript_18664/g.65210  ORF Transcript_18664/g.65210 Transcript_18664/m.65210 type:complete len:207 (-) Transcript_18664:1496-2116(-)